MGVWGTVTSQCFIGFEFLRDLRIILRAPINNNLRMIELMMMMMMVVVVMMMMAITMTMMMKMNI